MPTKSPKTKIVLVSALVSSCMLSGCASIVNGNNQVVSVETRHKGEAVAGATCQMTNGKGTFYVTTPGTVTVNRAYEDMSVKCEKSNYQPGLSTVKSSTKPMAFGNIIFGGIIGAGVDIATGSAYDYPSLITVFMGESNLIQPNPITPPSLQEMTSSTAQANPVVVAVAAPNQSTPAASAQAVPAAATPSAEKASQNK